MVALTNPNFKAFTNIIMLLLQTAEWLAVSEVLPCQKIRDTFKNVILKIRYCTRKHYTVSLGSDETLMSPKVNFPGIKSKRLIFRQLKKITRTVEFLWS